MTPRDFSTRARRAGAGTADLVFLALAGLVLSLSIASAAGAWSDLRRARADLDRARSETQVATRGARALEGRKGPDAAMSARALLTAEAPPARVLADLESLLPGDVRLVALTLEYGERLDLGLQLVARRAASYDRFVQSLQESPLFADVRPGEEVRDGGVRAQVHATHRGGHR